MRSLSDTWAVTVGPRRMVGGKMAPAVARDTPMVMLGDAELADALTEAYNSARARVNEQAGDYHLPQVPSTRSQAIMAYILLMRSAQGEDKRNAGHFKGRANEAAYKFANAGILNIIQTAYDLTKGSAPRTARVAYDILSALKRAEVKSASTSKRRRRRSTSTSTEYVEPVEDMPADSGGSWWPPSFPVAAGAAVALIGLAFVAGGRR